MLHFLVLRVLTVSPHEGQGVCQGSGNVGAGVQYMISKCEVPQLLPLIYLLHRLHQHQRLDQPSCAEPA